MADTPKLDSHEAWSDGEILRLVIEYDGTAYHGFQWQPNVPTVQAALEDALARVTRQRPRLVAAGRTDAGVHALGQVVSCHLDWKSGLDELTRALNGVLPDDIAVREAGWAERGFHARFSARSRTYRYVILNRPAPSPLRHRYAFHMRQPLDVAAMAEAAGLLEGQRDLAVFTGPGQRSVVRRIFRARCWSEGDAVLVEVAANAFLPHMMRHLVGTLVQIGRGRLSVEDFARIVATADRRRAGPAVPPQGLYLVQVTYDRSKES